MTELSINSTVFKSILKNSFYLEECLAHWNHGVGILLVWDKFSRANISEYKVFNSLNSLIFYVDKLVEILFSENITDV